MPQLRRSKQEAGAEESLPSHSDYAEFETIAIGNRVRHAMN